MTTEPIATVRPDIARDFVARSFHPDDWVALFGKAYDSGRVVQWVTPVASVCERRWLTWLQVMNAYRFNVYISVNAMTPGRRRTRAAVSAVRHVFLDVDHDGPSVLTSLISRADVPLPFCVVHSSPGRVQVLWRAQGFAPEAAERLQKHLAGEFDGDRAATSVTQTMRLPGFLNQKYTPPPLVSVEYGAEGVCGPDDFPGPAPNDTEAAIPSCPGHAPPRRWTTSRGPGATCLPSRRPLPGRVATRTRSVSVVASSEALRSTRATHSPCSPAGTRAVSRRGPSGS